MDKITTTKKLYCKRLMEHLRMLIEQGVKQLRVKILWQVPELDETDPVIIETVGSLVRVGSGVGSQLIGMAPITDYLKSVYICPNDNAHPDQYDLLLDEDMGLGRAHIHHPSQRVMFRFAKCPVCEKTVDRYEDIYLKIAIREDYRRLAEIYGYVFVHFDCGETWFRYPTSVEDRDNKQMCDDEDSIDEYYYTSEGG